MPKPGEVRRNQQKPEARLRHVKVSTNTRRIRNVRKTESQTSVLLSNFPNKFLNKSTGVSQLIPEEYTLDGIGVGENPNRIHPAK